MSRSDLPSLYKQVIAQASNPANLLEMSKSARILFPCLAIVFAAATAWILLISGGVDSAPSEGALSQREFELITNSREFSSSKRPSTSLTQRQIDLQRLKDAYVDFSKRYKSPRGWNDEDYSLAKDAIDSLGISGEMIELLGFLSQNSISNFGSREIEKLLASSDPEVASAARRDLLAIQTPSGNLGNHHRNFFRLAGKVCPLDEFAEFYAAIDDSRARENTILGHSQVLSQTNPAAAFEMIIEAYDGKSELYISEQGIAGVVGNFPSETDFAAFEQAIPPPDNPENHRDPMLLGQNALFERWAEFDPLAASSHALANADRVPPRVYRDMANQFAKKDASTAVAWSESLPAGPVRDEALVGLIFYSTHQLPDRVREIAGEIQNPKLRKKAIEHIEFIQAPVETDQ